MATLSPTEAAALLDQAQSQRGPRANFTQEERKARTRAMAAAAGDAKAALAKKYADEYAALYEVAKERRLVELEATDLSAGRA